MPTKATTRATGAATGARAAYWTPERRAQAAEAGRKGAAIAKERRTHVVDDDDRAVAAAAPKPVSTEKKTRKAPPADGIRVRQHRGGGHKSQFLATAEKDGKPMYRYGPTEDEARARMREALGG